MKFFIIMFLFAFQISFSKDYNSKILNFSLNKSHPISTDTISFDKSNYFIAGLISLNIKFPEGQSLGTLIQRGIIIGSRKNSSNIDELVLGNNLGLYFNLGNENTFGFFSSSHHLIFPDNTIDTIQQYSGIVNLFSYNVNSEIVLRLPVVDRKIIGGASITFFNIGATATYIKGGRYNGRFFGAVDVVPFYLQIYGKFALKNATFGFGTFINPYNFAEYRFGPKDFIGEEFGLKFNSAQFTKVGFIFFIYFD